MTFSYPVLTNEEMEAQRKVLEPGIYPFEVVNAETGISKSGGNSMVTLTLKIWDQNGAEFTIKDYMVGNSKMSYKIKHFWDSVGKPDKYLGNNDDYEFKGQCGNVKTKLEKEQNGERMFPRVVDYVSMESTDKNNQQAKVDDIIEDDIPF